MLEYFVTILIMVNPPGVIAPYLSLTSKMTETTRRSILYQSMSFATIILLISVFIGRTLLELMGISTFALQIAGGILFFKFGYDVMNDKVQTPVDESPGLVPLGFPIIAGPGSITAIIVISQTNNNLIGLSLVILVIMFILFVTLLFSRNIITILGFNATSAIVKIMGLLIITIGIQLILQGLQTWITSIPIFIL